MTSLTGAEVSHDSMAVRYDLLLTAEIHLTVTFDCRKKHIPILSGLDDRYDSTTPIREVEFSTYLESPGDLRFISTWEREF
jgi:hypothetical protein